LVREGLEDEVFRIEAAVNGLHMWQIGVNDANDESELNLERLLDVNAQIVSVDEDDVLLGNLEDMPNG